MCSKTANPPLMSVMSYSAVRSIWDEESCPTVGQHKKGRRSLFQNVRNWQILFISIEGTRKSLENKENCVFRRLAVVLKWNEETHREKWSSVSYIVTS